MFQQYAVPFHHGLMLGIRLVLIHYVDLCESQLIRHRLDSKTVNASMFRMQMGADAIPDRALAGCEVKWQWRCERDARHSSVSSRGT
jgi:hypothetical protein